MHSSFYKSLADAEKNVLDLYKSNSEFGGFVCFADHLNQSLRDGINLTGDWQNQAKLLDNIIRKYSCTEEILLYRATFDHFVAPCLKNNVFISPAFLSVSETKENLSRHYANAMGGVPVLLEIRCPKGTAMALMEGENTSVTGETERLLSRNIRLSIDTPAYNADKAEMNYLMGSFYASKYDHLLKYEATVI